MIETKIPMDIRVYKTKILGPFTARQLICIAVAAVVDVVIYATVYTMTGLSLQNLIFVLIFLDVPILAFTLTVQGLPMEKYLAQVLIPNFLAPAKRKAVHKLYEEEEQPMSKKEIRKSQRKVKSYAKKDKKYVAYK